MVHLDSSLFLAPVPLGWCVGGPMPPGPCSACLELGSGQKAQASPSAQTVGAAGPSTDAGRALGQPAFGRNRNTCTRKTKQNPGKHEAEAPTLQSSGDGGSSPVWRVRKYGCWFDPQAGHGQLEAPHPSPVLGIPAPLAFPPLEAAQGHSPETEMG